MRGEQKAPSPALFGSIASIAIAICSLLIAWEEGIRFLGADCVLNGAQSGVFQREASDAVSPARLGLIERLIGHSHQQIRAALGSV